MARLAVVGGHSLLGAESALAATRREIKTEALGDRVAVLDTGSYLLLQRHGLDAYTPPHRIDHVANTRALVAAGCDRVLAIGSSGSLRLDHPVGTFVAHPTTSWRWTGRRRSAFHDDAAATSSPASTTPGDRGSITSWTGAHRRPAGRTAASTGRRPGPASRPPAEIRFIGAPRGRRGDDDRLRVHRRRASWGSRTPRSASSTTSPTGCARQPLTVEEFEAGTSREPRPPARRARRGASRSCWP